MKKITIAIKCAFLLCLCTMSGTLSVANILWFIDYYKIRECKNKSIFVYFLFADLVSSLECFSSNGQGKKWDDDGEPYQCKVEPGAIKRHCVKFTRGNDFLCIDVQSVGATILLIW